MGILFDIIPLPAGRSAAALAALIACLVVPSSPAATGPADSPMFRWGAVGHNDRSSWGGDYPYNKLPLQQQMQLLTSAGMGWYRTSCETANCGDLVSVAKANGIKILKSIRLDPDDTLDESANYARGYAYAVIEGKNQNSAFTYFEASNELDNWVGMTGDGSTRSQYDEQRYVQARGLVRGMIDGIHAANASAKTMVDDAGWCHYGFLQMLWQDGVRWDVTAFHWYSDQGDIEHAGCNGANVAAIHAAFGLPVWITEFNSKITVNGSDQASAAWISSFMVEIAGLAAKYDIEAGFVYELLDEPSLSGMEAHFGLFDGGGNPKTQLQAVAKLLKSVPNPPVLVGVK